MRWGSGSTCAFAMFAAGAMLSVPARGDETPSVDVAAAEEARLQRSLDSYAEQSRRSRFVGVGAGLVEGGVVLPIGIYLATRSDERNLVGTGLIVEGSMALSEVPSLLWRGPLEKLRDRLARYRAGGMSAAEASQLIETEWAEEALRDRKYRPFWGIAGLVFSGLALGLGVSALLAPPVLGLGRHAQDTIGAIVVPLGLRAFGESASIAFGPTYVERAWDGYQRTDPRLGVVAPAATPIGVGPARVGAMASLGLVF